MIHLVKGTIELFLWITVFFACLPARGPGGYWISAITSILDSSRMRLGHLSILAVYLSCLISRLLWGIGFALLIFLGIALQASLSFFIFLKGRHVYDPFS